MKYCVKCVYEEYCLEYPYFCSNQNTLLSNADHQHCTLSPLFVITNFLFIFYRKMKVLQSTTQVLFYWFIYI